MEARKRMEMYQAKSAFVEMLSHVIHAADPDVTGLNYSVNTGSHEEHVEIHYASGLVRRANVTHDSKTAIIKDVMKYIK